MAKVSVLMPVYNGERFLAESIESILSQTFSDWELVIVNDGSTDKSAEICKSYSDKRIKYFANPENKGLIYTRSLAISKATSEFVAFLDSDDMALPDRLKEQVSFLENNPEYGFCGTWGISIDEDGECLKKINLPVDDQEIKTGLLYSNTFIQSSVMIRKSILTDEAYSRDFPVAEDYDLWCRLSRRYKSCNIPKHLTKYRWHNTNISLAKAELMNDLIVSIFTSQLIRIDIHPTQEELRIHMGIRDKNAFRNSERIFFKELRLWLLKLISANDRCSEYDKVTFNAMACFRWIFACKERRKYAKIFALLPYLIVHPFIFFKTTKLLLDRIR